MSNTKDALEFLGTMIEKKDGGTSLSFEDYLKQVQQEPQRVLRNIFQLFHGMVKAYVGKGKDDSPDDPQNIGFIKYDCSKLLAEGADNPYFVDTLFANRLVRQVDSLLHGQQNQIYVYIGPSGCGKSTFLNNLLRTFEVYTSTEEGRTYEISWEIDEDKLPDAKNPHKLLVPCPSHDYPILIIPKDKRAEFLKKLLPESETKIRIFKEKEYQWLFRDEACTICKSIFWALFERLGSLDKVLNMVKVRTHKFDRSAGEGISVFNPGDQPFWGMVGGKPVGYFSHKHIQDRFDLIFGASKVKYVFSHLAKTNSGIYVLMDVKHQPPYNKDRLWELHNIISEGVHKVGDVEEQIKSFFIATMNPEDVKLIEDEKMESFQGRINYNKISYVLEPATEVKIYCNARGESIKQRFLPMVLENFAKVVIASRLKPDCPPLTAWIKDIKKYSGKYCDENGFLLRMEIYRDVIPSWLEEADRKSFTAPIRRALIAGAESEGEEGFTGRESLKLFNDFLGPYSARQNLVNMDNVIEYFKSRIDKELRDKYIPKNFLTSLEKSYNYAILSEVRDALFPHNATQISEDILHFIWAVNYEPGDKVRCKWTKKEFEITLEFLKEMSTRLTGIDNNYREDRIREYTKEIQQKYTLIVAQGEDDEITKTELYQELFNSYIKNLREKVLEPYQNNANFRAAIIAYGTKEFQAFDSRLKSDVSRMIEKLIEKYDYTEQGAKEICLRVLNRNLVKEFSS